MDRTPPIIDEAALARFVPMHLLSAERRRELVDHAEIVELDSGERFDGSVCVPQRHTLYLLEGEIDILSAGRKVDALTGGSTAARFPLARLHAPNVCAVARTATRLLRVDRTPESGLLRWALGSTDASAPSPRQADPAAAAPQPDDVSTPADLERVRVESARAGAALMRAQRRKLELEAKIRTAEIEAAQERSRTEARCARLVEEIQQRARHEQEQAHTAAAQLAAQREQLARERAAADARFAAERRDLEARIARSRRRFDAEATRLARETERAQRRLEEQRSGLQSECARVREELQRETEARLRARQAHLEAEFARTVEQREHALADLQRIEDLRRVCEALAVPAAERPKAAFAEQDSHPGPAPLGARADEGAANPQARDAGAAQPNALETAGPDVPNPEREDRYARRFAEFHENLRSRVQESETASRTLMAEVESQLRQADVADATQRPPGRRAHGAEQADPRTGGEAREGEEQAPAAPAKPDAHPAPDTSDERIARMEDLRQRFGSGTMPVE